VAKLTEKQKVYRWVLGGHGAILLIIYLPYAFKSLTQLEIIAPGFWNLAWIVADLLIGAGLSFGSNKDGTVEAWWLAFGLTVLLSFPFCLGTIALNNMVHGRPA
jgi:hypothetical protein